MSTAHPYPPWLLQRQIFVLAKLLETDPRLRLRDWYLGALLVLKDESNPDRVALGECS